MIQSTMKQVKRYWLGMEDFSDSTEAKEERMVIPQRRIGMGNDYRQLLRSMGLSSFISLLQ
jgi:hypothetical protein